MGKFDPAKMKEFVPERPNGGLREQDLIMLADLRALHLGVVERELRFEPTRRWKADFAIPKAMLLVEIEGGAYGVHDKFGRFNRKVKGKHFTAKGFEQDIEKYTRAAQLGWTVLRFTTQQVLNGSARTMLRGWRAGLERAK
jgi:very-short-patch-repair endonuclease